MNKRWKCDHQNQFLPKILTLSTDINSLEKLYSDPIAKYWKYRLLSIICQKIIKYNCQNHSQSRVEFQKSTFLEIETFVYWVLLFYICKLTFSKPSWRQSTLQSSVGLREYDISVKVESLSPYFPNTLPGSAWDSNTAHYSASLWSKPSHYQPAELVVYSDSLIQMV